MTGRRWSQSAPTTCQESDTGTKYDYIDLKNKYVQGTMSIRALCVESGISTWSTVNARANREGWNALRAEFQRQVESRSLEAFAERRATKIAEIQLDALNVIHAGILKMAEDMDAVESYEVNGTERTRKVMRIHPRDLAILIDKFQSLIGQPQQINENRNLGVEVLSQADPNTLRDLLAALRPQPLLGRGEGTTPGPRSEGARTN